ncbi:MAG TPA: hypothetical protein VGE07_13485 [Herpetosiphonaceae bacterium]
MIRAAPVAETATALIQRHANGMVELCFKPAAFETAETAWANVRAVRELLPEPAEREAGEGLRPALPPLLLDLRGIAGVDPLARVCYLSPLGAAGSALALVADSPVSTLFGGFFMTKSRRHRPAQLFATRRQAAAWLEQFIALDEIAPPPVEPAADTEGGAPCTF